MTPQEVFDKAALGILEQGKRSLSAVGSCAYRGANGAKCAVGFLIPDRLYREEMDSEIFSPRVIALELKNEGVDLMDSVNLMCDLQEVHDDCNPDNWPRELERVADLYGLSPHAVKEWRNSNG